MRRAHVLMALVVASAVSSAGGCHSRGGRCEDAIGRIEGAEGAQAQTDFEKKFHDSFMAVCPGFSDEELACVEKASNLDELTSACPTASDKVMAALKQAMH
jgi:hypothetical protein